MPLAPQITNTPSTITVNSDFTVTSVANVQENTTFYQGTAPAANAIGDIWFDTSNGNKQYRWDGSSWVAVQDTAIAAASSAAAAAQATANTAQTTANGKNKVTYSTSAASGSGTTAGDIWFQYTTGGVIIAQWTWNGSSWASNTLNSTVIASLDAGKITAGTISVALTLQAATITGGSININSGTFQVSSAGAVTINSGSLNINGGTFQVTSAGALTATSANITGTITTSNLTATGGTIGGWTVVGSSYMQYGTTYLWGNSVSSTYCFQDSSRGIAVNNVATSGTGAAGYGVTTDSLYTTSNIFNNGTLFQSGNVTSDLNCASELRAVWGALTPQRVTNTPNCWISTSGQIRFSTSSSQRYKTDIVNLTDVPELNPKALYSLPVRAFRFKDESLSKEDDRAGVLMPGFIAEEMDAVYPIGADYSKENGVESWNDRVIVPALLSLIQDLNNRVKELEGN